MKRLFSTVLLVLSACFCATAQLEGKLVPQPATSYIKLNFRGKNVELGGKQMNVFFKKENKKNGNNNEVTLKSNGEDMTFPMIVIYMEPGKNLSVGKYPFSPMGQAYAHFSLAPTVDGKFLNLTMQGVTDDAVEITAIDGKVVTGKFNATLTDVFDNGKKYEVPEGSFRFTMP